MSNTPLAINEKRIMPMPAVMQKTFMLWGALDVADLKLIGAAAHV